MDTPWLLQYNRSIFCIPLKVVQSNVSSIHEPSYLQSAIVLFDNKTNALNFKKNHLIKILNNNTIVHNTSQDVSNNSVIDFKMYIDIDSHHIDDSQDINNIHLSKNLSMVADDNLTAISLNDIDQQTIILYSIFAHAIFLYINDIQVSNTKLILDVIALNPFKIDIKHNSDDILNDVEIKTGIIVEHLEKLYSHSESI